MVRTGRYTPAVENPDREGVDGQSNRAGATALTPQRRPPATLTAAGGNVAA